jgi:hypothetical protein
MKVFEKYEHFLGNHCDAFLGSRYVVCRYLAREEPLLSRSVRLELFRGR